MRAWRKGLLIGSCTVMLSGCGLGSANLREPDGRLAPCSSWAPRCVSSQESRESRKIAPFSYRGSAQEAQQDLVTVINSMERTEIVSSEPGYVYARFTSGIFRYVDDVEFVFRKGEVLIDVRSSGRIGYYDFGANRNRVEAIRAAFSARQNS